MCVTELELNADITEDEMPDEASTIGKYAGVAWGRADHRAGHRAGHRPVTATRTRRKTPPEPRRSAEPRQSIRSRISRTRSIVVCGCRNANLATVSPSHADGGMKAT